MKEYEVIIGLEIHLEIKTKSKFFCDCLNQETNEPNVNVCPICLGHPGVLPTINKEAIIKALKLGLALNGKIIENSFFERKNYFYPDLPKGYQISQYQSPLISGGKVQTEEGIINLERIHLEEDTAKVFHSRDSSLFDFNRAGVPLLEIVTKPEIKSFSQARFFLEELQRIIRYLEISDADMEKGQLRCDTNISIRPKNDEKYYPKTEIKNLNSFKAVENALIYEFNRQLELWKNGNPPEHQTTRGWNEDKGITIEQRGKEEEKDYRYFPEPDLPPINIKFFKEQGIDLDVLKANLPELPFYIKKRFKEKYGFDSSQADLLTRDKETATFVEKVISILKDQFLSLETVEGSEQERWTDNKKSIVKLLNKWLVNTLMVLQKGSQEKSFRTSPENFAEFLIKSYQERINIIKAQEILKIMFETKEDVEEVISKYEFKAAKSNDELDEIIQEVINGNPEMVEKIRQGKINVIQYLVGQVMKKTQGEAEPNSVKMLLEKKLRIKTRNP